MFPGALDQGAGVSCYLDVKDTAWSATLNDIPDCFFSSVVVVLVLDVDAMHGLRVVNVQHPRLQNMVN